MTAGVNPTTIQTHITTTEEEKMRLELEGRTGDTDSEEDDAEEDDAVEEAEQPQAST